jgi:hypothetical protein
VPTKWTIQVGEPITVPPSEADKDDTIEIAEAVRRRMDQMIADLLVQRRSVIFG